MHMISGGVFSGQKCGSCVVGERISYLLFSYMLLNPPPLVRLPLLCENIIQIECYQDFEFLAISKN